MSPEPSQLFPRTHCIRCGECCLRSSPTLQAGDRSLVAGGTLAKNHLYTVRRGELVWDNVIEALTVTRQEMIKIKEKEEGGCLFYDDKEKACLIYEKRPAQCSALACWDARKFVKVYREPKLTRQDLTDNGVLLGLMEEHEKRCGYEALETNVKSIEAEGEKPVERILHALRFDFHIRPLISKELGIDPLEMAFLFGRPLVETIAIFGLNVRRELDGTFFLTSLERKPCSETTLVEKKQE